MVSSVGVAGDVTFLASVDPGNGWLRLEPDGTGILYYDGEERTFTCDGSYFYFRDEAVPYVCCTADETGDTDLLMLCFTESYTAVALRKMEESE